MNFFGHKLKILIDIYEVTNRNVADAIHIDPSSISRWLNGVRVPSYGSDNVIKIAEYFSELENTHNIKNHLFASINNKQVINTDFDFKEFLVKWLSQEKSTKYMLNINHQKYKKDIYKTQNNKIGYMIDVKVFQGLEGLHNAFIVLFNLMKEINIPHELLITNQDAPLWQLNSKFGKIFMNELLKLLKKGHKVKVIFKTNEQIIYFSDYMKLWCSLIMTGNLEAWYFPKYDYSMFPFRLAIIPNVVSLYAVMTNNSESEFYTFLHSDIETIKFFNNKFYYILNHSKPLTNFHNINNPIELCTKLLTYENKSGNYILTKSSISIISIPLDIFTRVLDSQTQFTQSQRDILMNIYINRKKSFEKNVKTYSHREIYPLHILDNLINNCDKNQPEVNRFTNIFNISFCRSDLLYYLINLINMLEEYQNYEIAFTTTNTFFKNTNWLGIVKENYGAVIASYNKDGSGTFTSLNEATTINSAETYLENFWYDLPAINRNKEWIIRKLKSRLKLIYK